MKRTVFAALLGLAAIAGQGSAAEAEEHPFAPPPILPGQVETLRPAETIALIKATLPPTGCIPAGSISRSGVIVSVQLKFVLGQFTINNPDPADPQPNHEDPVSLRSYGGCKSGPTIYVKPGDTLRVDLTNATTVDDPSCLPNPPAGLGLLPGVGCFNTTNLHTHGLHVSPSGNSDNVLLDIEPNTQFPYEINLPADHPAGTFWYHAHRHGATAVQVASGTSGILIVRGDRAYMPPTPQNPHPIADIDTILHDARGAPMPEQLFLFQQISYACFENDPGEPGGPWQQIYTTKGMFTAASGGDVANAPWTCPLATPGHPVSAGAVENFGLQLGSPTIWDTNGRFTSINGIVQPTLTLPAGEIQRWRFVHAGIHDTINVQVVRATPVRRSNLIMASALVGNREQQKADVLASCVASPATLVPQLELAADGLTRANVHLVHASTVGGVLESNYLQPGYRSDILIAFPEEGDYCLLDQAAPPNERVTNGKGGQGPSTPQLLAYIHVRGGKPVTGDLSAYILQSLYDTNPQLPAAVRSRLRNGDLVPWAPFLESPAATGLQKVDFAIKGGPDGQPLFQVNGKSYDPDVVNFTRQVNTTDDWLLSSHGEPHIFHIHVNPFEIMDVTTTDKSGNQVSIFDADGHCKPAAIFNDQQQLANQYCGMYHEFRDTVVVENNYQVRIRTTYDRYIGEFVLHCHILDHEDGGMMMNVSIVPNLSAPGGGLGMPSMHHMSMMPAEGIKP